MPNGSTDSYAQTGTEGAFYIGSADVAGTIDVDCNDAAWRYGIGERNASKGSHKQGAGSNNLPTPNNNQVTINNVKTVYLSAENNFSTQVYPNPATDKIYINASGKMRVRGCSGKPTAPPHRNHF